MEYRKLGRSGLEVSLIGLGTMTWGEQNSQDEAFAQLDLALASGINFIDTAEMYPVPPRGPTQGATETIIGNWLAARNNREQVILASKVTGRSAAMDHIRGGPCLDAASVHAACEASLQRLQTDYLDLYQVHWPDRATNFFGQLGYQSPAQDDSVPIAETLGALDELVRAGKVRHVGVSNETPWGVTEYLRLAGQGLPRIASIQNPYNLLNRSYEIGLAEYADKEDLGLLAYSPLAFGVLSGKYLGGARPDGARLSLFSRFSRYTNARAEQATAEYVRIARNAGLDPAQMALAYVNSRPFLVSNLIGATTLDQLRSNIASAELRLSADVLEAIEAVHAGNPNPAP